MRILGILIIIAGIALFSQQQLLPALISIAIGAVFAGMPRKQAPAEDQGADTADSEYVRVETPLRKVPQVSPAFHRLMFVVEGVTENNDDGSSRQEILQKLCEGEDMAVTDVWFDDFVYARKIRIRVKTQAGCVGMIRQKDVDTIRGFFDKPVRMVYLEIDSALNDSGEREYHAEVVIIANRN